MQTLGLIVITGRRQLTQPIQSYFGTNIQLPTNHRPPTASVLLCHCCSCKRRRFMNKVWKRRESRVLSICMMLVILLQYKQRYYRSKQNLLATDFSSSLIDSSCWSLHIRLCSCTTKTSINALVKPAVSTYSVPQIRATCYDHVMLSIMDKHDISVNVRKPSRAKSSLTNIQYTWCNQDTTHMLQTCCSDHTDGPSPTSWDSWINFGA